MKNVISLIKKEMRTRQGEIKDFEDSLSRKHDLGTGEIYRLTIQFNKSVVSECTKALILLNSEPPSVDKD
tara:strand:+ start:425 stop:634 length:210 start_codon:yes stop_codon:yes gene_type:complete